MAFKLDDSASAAVQLISAMLAHPEVYHLDVFTDSKKTKVSFKKIAKLIDKISDDLQNESFIKT